MMRRGRDLARILESLVAAVDADAGAALYLDEGDGVLEPLVFHPSTVPAADRLAQAFRAGRPSTDHAVALIAVPDVRGGVLLLERRRLEPFSPEDLAIARLYARQLVERMAAGPGPRRVAWTSQLEAVQSVAAQLTRLTTVEEVTAALCTETRRVITFDNARVYVLGSDGETLEPVAFRPHAREYAGETADGLRLRVGDGITGWVAARGQPVIVPDSAHDPRALDVPGSDQVADESMLLAPLRTEGRVSGVVVLSRLGLGMFDEDDLRLLQVLADQAAVAVENARLLAARERLVTELSALLDISQATTWATDEPELARQLCSRLAAAARVEACVISRWDEGSTMLLPLAVAGLEGPVQARDMLVHRATRQVLLNGQPRLLRPTSPELGPQERQHLDTLRARSILVLPLPAAGRIIGLVELVSTTEPRAFDEHEERLLRAMANQAAAGLENARLVGQLRQAADVDLITGVHSRRHLQERLRQETARAARTGAPLSLLMVDLDDFKRVNDEHGHPFGDRVLRAVGACLRVAVRANDVVARYGGDEFVVLMPDTDAEQAAVVSVRLAEAVARQHHAPEGAEDVRITCSLGLAVYPHDGRTGASLIRAADAAMYRAKRETEISKGQPDLLPGRGRPRRAAGRRAGRPGPASGGTVEGIVRA